MATHTKALKGLDRLSVLLTTVATNTGPHPRYTAIRVEDEISGQLVLELKIPPDQLVNLLGNSSAAATGRVNLNTHRFGEQHHHEFRPINVPPDGSAKGLWGEQPDHPAVLAAKEQAHADGWEIAEYRYSHGKHSLVCRRWG